MSSRPTEGAAVRVDGGRLVLSGALHVESAAPVWAQALAATKTMNGRVVVDASKLSYCDVTGIGLLVDLKRRAAEDQRELSIEGLDPKFQQLLDLFESDKFPTADAGPHKIKASVAEDAGRAAVELWADIRQMVEFTGELSGALFRALLNPRTVRWADVFRVAEAVGANALQVVLLIGFLFGFVMAFQAAVPLKTYGADVFIPTLVGLAMLRELGPVMTAILLAGRSGSSFAAEIGTMKVNEEVNALETLGLDPVRFLVVPRVIAAVAMVPFLTLFANLAGLIGCMVVYVGLDYPPSTFVTQLVDTLTLTDLFSGLVKAFAFGILVAATGCMRGLQTKSGASAVGVSTTRAVVTSIILIIICDGVFAVIYYALGV